MSNHILKILRPRLLIIDRKTSQIQDFPSSWTTWQSVGNLNQRSSVRLSTWTLYHSVGKFVICLIISINMIELKNTIKNVSTYPSFNGYSLFDAKVVELTKKTVFRIILSIFVFRNLISKSRSYLMDTLYVIICTKSLKMLNKIIFPERKSSEILSNVKLFIYFVR